MNTAPQGFWFCAQITPMMFLHSARRDPRWRGSLLPLGCAAVVNPDDSVCLEKAGGRFATQREQAPSPQGCGSGEGEGEGEHCATRLLVLRPDIAPMMFLHSARRDPRWRGSLLPLGCAAVVNPDDSVCLEKAGGRFATQREQAPSPQGCGSGEGEGEGEHCATRFFGSAPRYRPDDVLAQRQVRPTVARELAPARLRSSRKP